MSDKLISANRLANKLGELWGIPANWDGAIDNTCEEAITEIDNAPAVDAVEVVRCEKCWYYHKPHVLCDDGTEKDYSEFPKEAFGIAGLVNGKYGINIGGKCEREKNCGYAEDKSVFRKPDDFCSYGERRDENAVHDGKGN